VFVISVLPESSTDFARRNPRADIRPANAEGTGKKACRLMRESPPTALGAALSFRTETRHLPSQAAQRKDTTSCPDRVAAAAQPSSVMKSRRFM
jgi:hypothetical protein